jgi:hypothetical protein
MATNDLIDEIHRHREELARRCDYDVGKLMEMYRDQEAASAKGGRPLVSDPVSASSSMVAVIREDPSPN